MRKQHKLSLQLRVTLLTATILFICSVSITLFSIYNADRILYPLITQGSVSAESNASVELESELVSEAMPAEKSKRLFDLSSIWFCVIITALGTGAVWFVSGKALMPIKEFSRQITAIDENNLSQRLPETTAKDEIGILTSGFNHMLMRLEQAFNRQKRFTSSAAHELKTPLATVKAGMQVLKRDENATIEDYKENADIAINSIDRLTSVVNDLLILASSDERKSEVKENIDLGVMFEAIFSEISPLYENQNIHYEIDCADISAFGDMSMLYRAFFNLVENAYKYNKPNGKITVKAYLENDSVFIDVADTGIGIPAEHLPMIFEAFYRVDSSRSRRTAGAGLGLSIVQTIIERCGGSLSIKSEVGEGTTFIVQLPNVE